MLLVPIVQGRGKLPSRCRTAPVPPISVVYRLRPFGDPEQAAQRLLRRDAWFGRRPGQCLRINTVSKPSCWAAGDSRDAGIAP